VTIRRNIRTETEARRQALRNFSLRLYPDSVLREPCTLVEQFDSTLSDLLAEMRVLMLAHCGIGLAGPQVEITQQLFITEIDGCQRVLINPDLPPGPETEPTVEGCLSLPGIRVNVCRPARVAVTGFDPRGKRLAWEADGLWVRVIQHETDHLHGVLIVDYGPPVREETVDRYPEMRTHRPEKSTL